MDLNYLSDDIDDIRYFACRHGLKIGEVIELLKLEHLKEISSELSEIHMVLSDERNSLNSKVDLDSIESSIYSVTTAVEKLDKNY